MANTTPPTSDACTTPFSLSLITATKGSVTKRLFTNAHGEPSRDPTHRLGVSAGRLEHVSVAGLGGLVDLLTHITSKQVLVHGVPRGSTPGEVAQLTTVERLDTARAKAPDTLILARSKTCIVYPPGTKLLMFDVDPSPEAPRYEQPADIWGKFVDIWPAFAEVGYLAASSTSSAIKRKDTGDWLRPPEGWHLYFLATGDVERWRGLAKIGLWLAGHGWCKLATPNAQTGVAAVLERCLVDLSVWSPERLDFVAGADLPKDAPFYQDRPAPTLHPGSVLDLDALPDVSDAQRDQYAALVTEARERVLPQRRALVRQTILPTRPDADDTTIEAEIDLRLTHAANGLLTPDHLIYFRKRTQPICADKVTAKLDTLRCADPLEPDYREGEDAVFHWNGGRWCIVSWAHGQQTTYRLAVATPEAPAPDADESWPDPEESPQAPAAADGTAPDDTVPLSDTRNAIELVQDAGVDLRYCHPWGKWLHWTGTHWQTDDTGHVMRLAKGTIQRMVGQGRAWLARVTAERAEVKASAKLGMGTTGVRLDQMALTPREEALLKEEKAALTWLGHCRTSLSDPRLKGMLSQAQSEPGIPVLPADLDRHSWLLNCANGTLDLRTGTLQPHARVDLLTQCLTVAYDPDATCPTWDAFLAQILPGSHALRDYVQCLCGVCLTGETSEHLLPVLWGTGSNGKSTFINTVLALLGSYAMKAPTELLVVTKSDRHPTEKADLFGKRLVACVETEEGARLNETFVKEATGGDPIRARRMREDFWEFDPTHKIFLATNHKPAVRGTDHAIWRRLKLIPFTVTIPDHAQDKTLPGKLLAELPGILAWAVRGCLAWQRDGLHMPEEVQKATAEYRDEQDALGNFLAECCLCDASNHSRRVKASNLYVAYEQWCESSNEHTLNKRNFGLRLTERGFTKYLNNGTWYLGIGLLTDGTEGTEGTEGIFRINENLKNPIPTVGVMPKIGSVPSVPSVDAENVPHSPDVNMNPLAPGDPIEPEEFEV